MCWSLRRGTVPLLRVCRVKAVTDCLQPSQVEGITLEIMEAALRQAADGRRHILAQMGACEPAPRGELGPYTPRILIVTVRVCSHFYPLGPTLSLQCSVCLLHCFV